MSPLKRMLTLAGAVLTAMAMVAGPAIAQTPPVMLIGPNQYFAGEVNGNIGQSVLSVLGCPSSTTTGSGEVLPGQTVEAHYFPVPPPGPGGNIVGYTGLAHSISADLQVAQANPPLIYIVHIANLTTYDTKATLPYNLSVPCDATITAVFTPINGGPTAMNSDVSLKIESPRIVANPNVAHPGQTITLTGTGFAPNSTYTVKECSKTSWIAPQDPCVNSNNIQVATDTSGSFTASFVVEACSPALTGTCYIGVPEPQGVDVIVLAGAARITVF
ncbi:MAG TPA: neocarzinostatin apoprotein domain-containing protein [Actinomycetota bacterium]